MTQTEFFATDNHAHGATLRIKDVCAARHKGNPESLAANERAECTKARQRRNVYEAVCAAGDLTCRDLANAWGVGMNVISGRFTELKAAGMIVKTGVRDGCAVYRVAT